MRISKLVAYDFKNLMTSWLTYFSFILCILPAYAIAYSIANLGGPFEVIQLTYFYAFFGNLLVVIIAMLPFTRDISQNTIVLLMNEKSNRTKYYLAKTITIIIVGLIFGIVGALSTFFLAGYADLEVTNKLLALIVLHFVLYTLFYGTLFLTLSVFYNNVLSLFIIALLSIMLLSTLLGGLLMWEGLPEFARTFISEYLPLYFLPEVVGSHNWLSEHYISTSIGIIIFVAIGLIKVRHKDY